ncbi:MauE/DoxX family redox-associated membrane protein [Streptomyces tritici]|uniref:MauE/DoxX family redox-associated membrane protein n=1 Tax=Streptomyces tritici TaxID=2054410 RepID=UPI003AF1CF5A
MYYLGLAARLLLVLVFLAAVVGKTRRRPAFTGFAASLAALRLFPRGLATPVAAATVGAEALTAVLLAVPATAAAGLGLAIAVLAAFVAGILAARRGGRLVPCHCFGATSAPLGLPHVIRNALLVAVAAVGLAALTAAPGAVHPGGLALAAGTAAIGALMVVRMDDLLALVPTTR